MAKCRITVLKRTLNQDLVDSYLSDSFKASGFGPCDQFKDGQVFLFEGFAMPAGFCPWAWADIQRDAAAMYIAGGNLPWVNRKGTAIVCCTDGFRPVVFKIERVEE